MKAEALGLLVLIAWGCGGTPPAAGDARGVSLPNAPAANAYAIHLHRASRVGERAHIVLETNDDRKTTTSHDGKVLETKREVNQVRFDAVSTVVAVDAKQDTTRVGYDVTDLTSAGKSIFRGKVDLTRAPKETDAVLLANGAPPEKEVMEALKAVLSLRVGGPNDDDIFGSTEPRMVGAHWPINGKLAQEDLAADEGMRSSSVSGDATLVSITRVSDLDCLEIHSEIHLSGIEVPNLPAGSTIQAGDMTAEFSGIFPIDEAHGRLEDHMVFRMTLRISVPTAQGEMIIASSGASRKDGHFSAL